VSDIYSRKSADALAKYDTRYAIYNSERKVLAASDTAFLSGVLERDIMSGGTDFFRLDEFGAPPLNYLGLVNIEGMANMEGNGKLVENAIIHGGAAEVSVNPRGGACFTLKQKTAGVTLSIHATPQDY